MTGTEFKKQFGGMKRQQQAEEGGSQRSVIANPHSFREVVKELRVLSRVSPQDKEMLCTGLAEDGNTVAAAADDTLDLKLL